MGAAKPIDGALYLPLPTNEEQIQIVHQMEGRQGILVQGPPGTGKSHTIANLICHLLAQGKRVLVTSQTPRALKVLKEKIPPDMAALCVTLLGNDRAARQELETSVHNINQKYSDWNSLNTEKEITSLKSQLFEIQKSIASKERLLTEQREVETYQHRISNGAYAGTAQQIAQRVKDEESLFGWLVDDASVDKPCPLSNSEFTELLHLYAAISDAHRVELEQKLIGRNCLPDISQFVKMVDDETAAKRNIDVYKSQRESLRFRILLQTQEERMGSLGNSIRSLITAIGRIDEGPLWISQAVADILGGQCQPWKELRQFMSTHFSGLRERAMLAQNLKIKYTVDLDKSTLRADAVRLLTHLEAGGKLGWAIFAPQVVRRTRYLTKEVWVNGEVCSNTESLRLLVAYLQVVEDIDCLWSALQGKEKRVEGPLPLQVGYLYERFQALGQALGLESYLNVAKTHLRAITGLTEPRWHRIEELEDILLDIEAVEADKAVKRSTSAIEEYLGRIRELQASNESHMLNLEFINAIDGRDAIALAKCLDKLEQLEKDRERLFRREKLRERVSEAAPKLGGQLQSMYADKVWQDRASTFEQAWAWKQADAWLAKFREEHDETRLTIDLCRLSERQRGMICKLTVAKAWENCLQRMTEHQRNSLIAWAKTMKRIGRGTGKYVPLLRRQAQQCMDECKKAIPAWIMPLYRVFDTVNPESEAFDVVIIDEASQTGPDGLVIQYIGMQCVVVGDDQQISPEAEFMDQTAIHSLIERYLGGIPFGDRFEPQCSVFDQADIRFGRKFGGRIVLREHFRCMPEIIEFSNELCYRDTPLKPLRQYPPLRLNPIVVRHVKNGFREDSGGRILNRPEADELVETLARFCSLPEYDGKTMGVISLQGEDQARYIESRLLNRLPAQELERRRIVCGDAYAFQGDERDVMFLSMVAAYDERKRHIQPLTGEAYKRRFNVAASRARDQLVLFHTATLSELNPECMRHKLLKYCLNPVREKHDIDLSRCESKFEEDVCRLIASKGYVVITQYQVAGYRIDLVVQGTRSRLAVECDGDEWHGIEQYERDVARQRLLERCGWRFFRIRGYEYYRDPQGSLMPLWNMLFQMGIEPSGTVTLDREDVQPNKDSVLPKQFEYTNKLAGQQTSLVREEAISREQQPPTASAYKSNYCIIKQPLSKSSMPEANLPRITKSLIYEYPPDFFYELAHHSKDENKLQPWERNLLFRIGTYRNRGWQITQKMEKQGIRIIEVARALGLVNIGKFKVNKAEIADDGHEAHEHTNLEST